MNNERVAWLFDVDDATKFGHVRDFTVTRVRQSDVEEFCRRWHYTNHRGSSAACSYGIWDGHTLVGVVAYSILTMPASQAFFGPERWDWMFHMGRLVCADAAPRNSESRLIAESLRMLKRDRPVTRAVATYASAGAGHVGYVYQATNALYLGTTEAKSYYIDMQGRRRTPKQNGGNVSAPKALARGWTVHLDPPKHRYVYLLGSKAERREARALLRFPVLPYPKAPLAIDHSEETA